LAAAKGEQDIPVHRILTMFLLSAPAALLKFSGRKIAFFPLLPRIYAECERQAWGKTIFCPTTISLPSNSCKQRKRLPDGAFGLTW